MIFIQDEKNQILTTNIWLNLVRQGSTLQTQQTYERCFTRLLFRMKGTMFRVEGCYYLKCKVFLHQKGLFTRSRHSPFQILSDIAHCVHVWHRHSLHSEYGQTSLACLAQTQPRQITSNLLHQRQFLVLYPHVSTLCLG